MLRNTVIEAKIAKKLTVYSASYSINGSLWALDIYDATLDGLSY